MYGGLTESRLPSRPLTRPVTQGELKKCTLLMGQTIGLFLFIILFVKKKMLVY